MVLYEESECSVCYLAYSRQERVPRLLRCRHTFCTPCLEKMVQTYSGLLTVRCPLCRQITWVSQRHGIQEALYINTVLWEQMSEEEEDGEGNQADANRQGSEERDLRTRDSSYLQCSKNSRPKLRLPGFLKKLSFPKQPQEEILPRSNVEMKSWRRLTAEEML